MTNVCVSVWIRGVAESEKGRKKQKKSAIPLNDNLSELFFSRSSSFITLSTPHPPPPNPSTRTAHPSLGHPISATYKVTHFTYLSWLFLSFFFFEGVSVYARASLPIYNFFFYLSNGGKVNTGVGADVSRIKACDDFEVCLLWSVISAPQCSPCHGCLRL